MLMCQNSIWKQVEAFISIEQIVQCLEEMDGYEEVFPVLPMKDVRGRHRKFLL